MLNLSPILKGENLESHCLETDKLFFKMMCKGYLKTREIFHLLIIIYSQTSLYIKKKTINCVYNKMHIQLAYLLIQNQVNFEINIASGMRNKQTEFYNFIKCKSKE